MAMSLVLAAGCSWHETEMETVKPGLQTINISGGIEQDFKTRASDTGFVDGDQIGIYVVDYKDEAPGELLVKGNRADNLRFTFDEPGWKWIPDHDIYWKDTKTHIDIYGYYPYQAESPESIESFPFELQMNQAAEATGNKLGGYEQSDFLWGVAPDNAPTDRTITLKFKHIMAGIRVTLVEGSGFDESEWGMSEKSVILQSAIRTAEINLRTGAVTPVGSKPAFGTIAAGNGTDWRCVTVPQTIPAG